MIELTHQPIDYHALTEAVRSPQSGAVVLFLGTVRELTAGRQTVALDYEGYPAMAEAKLKELEKIFERSAFIYVQQYNKIASHYVCFCLMRNKA